MLKKILLSLTFSSLLLAAHAQNTPQSPLEDMVNAVKNNHVKDMVKYFNTRVPITINNTQSVYSRNQAEIVLTDFFEKNNPKDFAVMDSGAPNTDSKFVIADFSTPNGKYSVYILMRQKDNSYMLQEIRLNKE